MDHCLLSMFRNNVFFLIFWNFQDFRNCQEKNSLSSPNVREKTMNNKENAELQLQNAMALLKYSMNCPLDSTFLLATSISKLSLNALSPSLGSVNDNSTLKLLENQIKLSACDVKNNKAGFLPSLSAYFQQSYNAYRTTFDFFSIPGLFCDKHNMWSSE